MPKPNPPYLSHDTDRHGNVRWYVRVSGKPKVRIREQYGTQAFWAAYRDALSGRIHVKPADTGRRVIAPAQSGSLRSLCETYYRGAEFKGIDSTTRRVRRSILERLCHEATPSGKLYGDLPYRQLLPRHVRAMRDARFETPGAANSLLKALRQLFTFAVNCDLSDTNPAKEVPYLPPVRAEGIPAWTDADVENFKSAFPSGTMGRLALMLFMELGQRISDVHRLGPSMMKDGAITFTQWKNRRRNPITLTLPISEDLRAVLTAIPPDQETFLVNDWGRPFASTAAFGNKFRDWCRAAGLTCRSAHGLRKHFAAKLAERGASDREIMSMTGHRTSKEVDRYTRSASQKRL
ncbi:MAG: hypothetical protein B7X76_08355, partial [Azorhizobium sp. 39-67-5]